MWRPERFRRTTTPTPVTIGSRPTDGRARGAAGGDKASYSACWAPTVSMYFDQFGSVRACCQNTETLMGSVTTQSIREIWESANTRRMRAALAVGDFSEGCGFCAWQVGQGDEAISFARAFDHLQVHDESPYWPVQMEFSMSNACNLQCVMCNGDWSSSIRAHREHRAPLPEVYGERFFDELAEFLPHLTKVNILGGEPFLGKEPLRLMEMLAGLDEPPQVAVTTNGTQWSPRIEGICERLPLSFVVSLDGITKETYESIRVGSDFDAVLRNIDRFREYAARHGTAVSLAHCLMRPNWHQFAQLLRFAEDREMLVGMNEVLFPPQLSLFQMTADELRPVVRSMEQDAEGVAGSLRALRGVWDGQLDALRHRLEVLESGESSFVRPWGGGASSAEETWRDRATRLLTEWDSWAPTLVVIHDTLTTNVIEGPKAYHLQRVGAEQARSAEELIDLISTSLHGEPEVSRIYTDLLSDVVISERASRDALEYRLTWNREADSTTVLVAIRNAPLAPADAVAVLAESCPMEQIIVLTCDPSGRVLDLEGPADAVPPFERSWCGSTLDEIFEELAARFGTPVVEPGPSGYPADASVRFQGDDGTTHLDLRSITDRGSEVVRVYLGEVRSGARAPRGRFGGSSDR